MLLALRRYSMYAELRLLVQLPKHCYSQANLLLKLLRHVHQQKTNALVLLLLLKASACYPHLCSLVCSLLPQQLQPQGVCACVLPLADLLQLCDWAQETTDLLPQFLVPLDPVDPQLEDDWQG